jgi:hypothetical protein
LGAVAVDGTLGFAGGIDGPTHFRYNNTVQALAMPGRYQFFLLLLAVLVAASVGCSKSREDLVKTASAGEEAARAAQAETAARSATRYADLAFEEHDRREKLGSLKARAYQKTRAFILTTTLPRLARAAEKAGGEGTNQLSAVDKPMAEQGWGMVHLVGGRPPLADGQPDWSGAAADLWRWSTNPPIEFRAFLGLAMISAGSPELALAELESVDVATLQTTNALQIYYGGRALLYAHQGWNQLAGSEVEAFMKHADVSKGEIEAQHVVAMFHVLMAGQALKNRELKKADEEIAQCVKAWPNNPWAVFLTGERLAANGEWEKAAESLEANAAGSKDEWFARKLAQRARDLRDGKGSTKALILDAGFLLEFVPRAMFRVAQESESGQRAGEILDEARAFADRLHKNFPWQREARE